LTNEPKHRGTRRFSPKKNW